MKLLTKCQEYLETTLEVQVQFKPWEGYSALPLLLRKIYEFYSGTLYETPCLFIVSVAGRNEPGSVVKKHLDLIRNYWSGQIVYVCPVMASFNRKRYIHMRIPFIIPANQMYLPFLAVDLREYYLRREKEKRELLGPAAQLVLLYAILHKQIKLQPQRTARALGYTTMTISRVFQELRLAGLASIEKSGRNHTLFFKEQGKGVWHTALSFLGTPVRNKKYVLSGMDLKNPLSAGYSALPYYSSLAEPQRKTVAVTSTQWNGMKNAPDAVIVDTDDPEALEIEIWKYDPRPLASGNIVDPLSLYLSLRETGDERTEAALEEMLEGRIW